MRIAAAAWCGPLVLTACHRDPGDSATSPSGLPPTTFVVEEPYPPGAPHVDWFAEVTGSGLDAEHVVASDDPATRLAACGIAAGDVNGDGVDDLVLTTGWTAPRLFLGGGDLTFTDATTTAGLGDLPASSVRLADLDGDGLLDLLLGRDDQPVDSDEDAVRLLKGHGDGTFADVTATSGIQDRGIVRSLGLLDADGDGLLDVYVAHSATAPTTTTGRADALYRARGDGAFEPIHDRLPLDTDGMTWVVASFDPDGDGRRELFAGNDSFIEDDGSRPIEPASENWGLVQDRLLVAAGPGPDGYPTFTERADPAVNELRATMNALASDFDGDGRLDLYLSDFGRNELLLRQADGSYLDATETWGLAALSRDDARCPPGGFDLQCLLVSWAAVREDLDLDGAPDLLVLNGQILADDGRQPVAVWRGGATLSPVQTDLPWMDARTLVAHDLDRDGDLDLVVATWSGPFRVFENRVRDGSGDPPGFASIRLRGTQSPPDGTGARLAVDGARVFELGTGGMPYGGQPVVAHLGLGAAAGAQVTVTWPSGVVQTLDVAADQAITADEPRWFTVSRRTAPADGATEVEVVVTPRDATGALRGPGLAVDVSATLGTWTGPVADLGDGSYRRVLVAPAAPGLAALTVTADGFTLRLQPRITFE